jgi:hypothetical protein
MTMSLPKLQVTSDSREFEFVLAEVEKANRQFHMAVFFSKSVLSNAIFNYPRSRRVAILTESPIDDYFSQIDQVVQRFPVVLTHQRELITRGPPFLPLMFGTNWLGARDAESTGTLLATVPRKTGMVSFLGSLEHPDSGAYRFRREVAELALRRGDVQCFGKGIRPVAGKFEAIAPFRFSIAMENAASDYYFSEKLIDCLLLESVPIYFGCPGIGELLDVRGMLCFRTVEELSDVLDSLSVERYQAMLPYARANRDKVIGEQWHSHHGLFSRLAAALAGPQLAVPSHPIQRCGPVRRGLRTFWENVFCNGS